MADLHGSFWKTMRARQHFNALNAEMKTWRSKQFYEILTHGNFDDAEDPTVRVMWKVHVLNQPPTEQFGLMVGDAVQNLRSALDHAVYDAIADGTDVGTLPDAIVRRIQFPIEETIGQFRGRIRPFKELLTEDAIAVMEERQPIGSEPGRFNAMRVLRELSNRDKHRALTIVPAVPLDFTFEIDVPGLHVRNVAGLPIADGMVLATAKIARGAEQAQFNMNMRVEWIESVMTHSDARPVPAGVLLELLYTEVFDTCAALLEPVLTDGDRVALRVEAETRQERIESALATIE